MMLVHSLKYGLSGEIFFGTYSTGENAIQIIGDEGVVATPTVNLQDWGERPSGPDQIWIKTWSENEGMDHALVVSGVIETPFLAEARGGYANNCRAVLAKLTPAALAELENQKKESV